MKATIEIPDADVEAARRLTGAANEADAIVQAVKTYIKEQMDRAARAKHLFGSMPNLMTQADLESMREDKDLSGSQ